MCHVSKHAYIPSAHCCNRRTNGDGLRPPLTQHHARGISKFFSVDNISGNITPASMLQERRLGWRQSQMYVTCALRICVHATHLRWARPAQYDVYTMVFQLVCLTSGGLRVALRARNPKRLAVSARPIVQARSNVGQGLALGAAYKTGAQHSDSLFSSPCLHPFTLNSKTLTNQPPCLPSSAPPSPPAASAPLRAPPLAAC